VRLIKQIASVARSRSGCSCSIQHRLVSGAQRVREDESLFVRICAAYDDLARAEPERRRVLDAERPPDDVLPSPRSMPGWVYSRMHFHIGSGVAKLARCARGSILDVAVDLRRGSPTYGQWEGVELDDQSMRELYVPVGFAHGFCVLSEVADVMYKQSAYYDPAVERGIAWDDPEVGIQWPLPPAELIVSERDAQAPRLSEVADELPFSYSAA
jgi:dTDP-4-dehydrorhamnose 3,5-epimerase